MRYVEDAGFVIIGTDLLADAAEVKAVETSARQAKERGLLTLAAAPCPYVTKQQDAAHRAEVNSKIILNAVDALILFPTAGKTVKCVESCDHFTAGEYPADDKSSADNFAYWLSACASAIHDLVAAENPLMCLMLDDVRQVFGIMGIAYFSIQDICLRDGDDADHGVAAAATCALKNLPSSCRPAEVTAALLGIRAAENWLTMEKIDGAIQAIHAKINDNADILFGAAIDAKMEQSLSVSIFIGGTKVGRESL